MLYVFASLPAGYIADKVNRVRLVAFGLLLWSTMTILCGFATSFTTLFAARVGVGVGEAFLGPAAISLIADLFSTQHRGRAISFYQSGSYIGSGASLGIGGLVLLLLRDREKVKIPILGQAESWRVVFFVVGLIGVLLAPIILATREPVRRGRQSETEPHGFVAVAHQHRRFLLAVYAITIVNAAIGMGGGIWGTVHFIRDLHMTPSHVGLIIGLVIAGSGSAGALVAGVLADRGTRRSKGKASPLVVGFAMLLPGVALFPLLQSPILGIAAFGVVIFATAMVVATIPAILSDTLPNEARGTASSIYFVLIVIAGLGIAPVLIGLVNGWVFSGSKLYYSLEAVLFPCALIGLILATTFPRDSLSSARSGLGKSIPDNL